MHSITRWRQHRRGQAAGAGKLQLAGHLPSLSDLRQRLHRRIWASAHHGGRLGAEPGARGWVRLWGRPLQAARAPAAAHKDAARTGMQRHAATGLAATARACRLIAASTLAATVFSRAHWTHFRITLLPLPPTAHTYSAIRASAVVRRHRHPALQVRTPGPWALMNTCRLACRRRCRSAQPAASSSLIQGHPSGQPASRAAAWTRPGLRLQLVRCMCHACSQDALAIACSHRSHSPCSLLARHPIHPPSAGSPPGATAAPTTPRRRPSETCE